jgi:hypothetical protein
MLAAQHVRHGGAALDPIRGLACSGAGRFGPQVGGAHAFGLQRPIGRVVAAEPDAANATRSLLRRPSMKTTTSARRPPRSSSTSPRSRGIRSKAACNAARSVVASVATSLTSRKRRSCGVKATMGKRA